MIAIVGLRLYRENLPGRRDEGVPDPSFGVLGLEIFLRFAPSVGRPERAWPPAQVHLSLWDRSQDSSVTKGVVFTMKQIGLTYLR